MRKLVTATVLALGLLGAQGAQAQAGMLPLSLEVRGGGAFPTGDFGEDLDTGLGFGALVGFELVPGLEIYGGYERYDFGATGAEEFDGVDADVTDSGFSLGGRFSLPVASLAGVGPWVRAGALWHTVDVEADVEGFSFGLESDRALGFEIGAGLSVPLGMVVSVVPAVTYRSYGAQFDLSEFGEPGEELDVTYFAAELGLRIGM